MHALPFPHSLCVDSLVIPVVTVAERHLAAVSIYSSRKRALWRILKIHAFKNKQTKSSML